MHDVKGMRRIAYRAERAVFLLSPRTALWNDSMQEIGHTLLLKTK